jgi:hypothetical protein
MGLNEFDFLIKSTASQLSASHAILCLYTGAAPAYCEPMARDPLPSLDWPLVELPDRLVAARRLNVAVEDGALMFGRQDEEETYRSTGWSYRLYPPAADIAPLANKGSAFNSCLLMSQVDRIDLLYQLTGGRAWRFERGVPTAL